jgi:hypothetical protein
MRFSFGFEPETVEWSVVRRLLDQALKYGS